MMKNSAFLSGSAAGLAAVAKLDTTVSFLVDRRQTTAVSPAGRVGAPGFVWKRVFLKGKGGPRS